ncbi:MAG: O-antigen ligase family protein, partial [Nitrospinota bacterium]|nr:O-antigen ligase family protein [Nitrospinota bacterium]
LGDINDKTAIERIYMWKSGLRMIRDHPLFGLGPDSIKPAYPRYADPRALKKESGHLHNNFIHIGAERGLPALAAWIWIWAAYFVATVRRLGPAREGASETRIRIVGSLAAISGFLFAGLFEYNFGDSEVVMLAYFIMALPFVGEEKGSA